MPEPAVTLMPADDAARLAEFARACKAAARAVSLYPGRPSGHRRLARPLWPKLTARLTQGAHSACRSLRSSARQRRIRREARSGHRRAGVAAASTFHRRHDAERRAPTPRRGARCCCSWRGRRKKCGRTAGSRGCGPPPAGRASRSRRSTTPRCCAKSRVARRRWNRSSPPPSPAPQLQMDDSGMRLLLDIVGDPAAAARR